MWQLLNQAFLYALILQGGMVHLPMCPPMMFLSDSVPRCPILNDSLPITLAYLFYY